MRSTHACPGCRAVEIPDHMLACRPCWFKLPEDLRREINNAWANRRRNPHDQGAHRIHRDALITALAWYRTSLRTETT